VKSGIFLWSELDRIGLALIVILMMLAVILGFIAPARWNRLAAWLFAPNAAWVAFAAVLNGSIWMLN
jgi:tryptophan-rich sensory protein